MNKIYVLYNENNAFEAEIVYKGLVRSFTKIQVEKRLYSECSTIPSIAILIEPKEKWFIKNQSNNCSKYVILGKLDQYFMDIMETSKIESSYSDKIVNYKFAKLSQSKIYFQKTKPFAVLFKNLLFKKQHCCRFDFTNEWNNLGYGRIVFDNSPFALADYYTKTPNSLANIKSIKDNLISEFVSIRNFKNCSILWINRKVGLVDSAGWSLLENYISDYREEDLPTLPYLKETANDWDAIITMRLDCDQDIYSAKKLCNLYFDLNVPISLAITTNAYIRQRDLNLIRTIQNNNGSILSHSLNHYSNWGGSYTHALLEAKGSIFWFNRELNLNCEYAVSPFHQNPLYAIKALKDSGYKGFVGGIIHNDPEYLIYRSGEVPFVKDIVSLSQQCMLHGDCYHAYNNSISPYINNFLMKMKMNSIFGYLDHPFSNEYQYGWLSEDERLNAHFKLLTTLKKWNIKFFSLCDAMKYVYERSKTNIIEDNGRYILSNRNELGYSYNLSKIKKYRR